MSLSGASRLESNKRGSPSCALLREDAVRLLPVWQAISDYATQQWGSGWSSTVTNPPEYPDRPALACVSGSPPLVALNDPPGVCSSSKAMSPSINVGKDGRVTLSYQNGTRSTSEFIVSQAAAFPDQSAGLILSPLAMPALGEDMAALPVSVSINNTILATAKVDGDGTSLAQIEVPASPGQSCALVLTNTTCTATGTTRIRVTAQGWMWFYYNTTRHDHFRWTVQIENTSDTSIEDRSTYIYLNASITSSRITAAVPQCLESAGTSISPQQPADAPSAHDSGIAAYKIVVPIGIVVLLLGAAVGFFVGRRRKRAQDPGSAGGDASELRTETVFSPQGAGDSHTPESTHSDGAPDPPPAYSSRGAAAPTRRRK